MCRRVVIGRTVFLLFALGLDALSSAPVVAETVVASGASVISRGGALAPAVVDSAGRRPAAKTDVVPATAATAEAPTAATTPTASAPPAATPAPVVPDSIELEKSLQSLTWPQFRAVLEAVPKLKRSVDAYGVFGWEYAKANYRTYRWRKSIDRMDDEKKIGLADLIARARAGEDLRAAGS